MSEQPMHEITIRLSDQALADLHAVQLKLRAKWKAVEGFEDRDVTQYDAIRTALAMCVADDWDIADLMPTVPQ